MKVLGYQAKCETWKIRFDHAAGRISLPGSDNVLLLLHFVLFVLVHLVLVVFLVLPVLLALLLSLIHI